MKPKFENIKTKAKEFMKTDKAKIGGACVCALLICVGVGFGVNAISGQNSQNLPSKALENTVEKSTKTEGENTEKSSENATENTSEHTDEVTVNDKGEVVDSLGNVVAESVEQYNANLPAQSRPVDTSNTATPNNTHQTQPSGSTQPAQQQHVHNWVLQYKTIYHDAVYEEHQVCVHDGTIDPDRQHIKEHLLNGASSQTRGTLIKVKDSWTETIPNGYACSECGANK